MALEVAEEFASNGKGSIEVIDLRTLVPLDKDAIYASVRKTNRVLILHEDNLTAGFGAEIAALVTEFAFESLDAPVMRLASFDSPVPFAPNLEKMVLPSKQQLSKALTQLLKF